MTDESNTPAEAGTDFVSDNGQPEQIDTRPDWDYFDPDEDTEEAPETDLTDDDGQDDDEDPNDPDDEPEADEEDESEAATAVDLIELPDGSKVERDEVVKGYLRQSDYTRKTADVAQRQRALEAESTRINGITEAFIDHLSRLIPANPDPQLAYRDPNAYTRQKAAHDAAVAQVQQIIQVGEQAKQAQSAVNDVELNRVRAEESQRLAERFPQIVNPKGRDAFFAQAAEAAQSAGFSQEELGQVMDHRLFTLAHYASLGMKAEQARGKAREKVAKAPPAAPTKPGNAAVKAASRRQRDAIKALEREGTFEAALRVDWD